MVSSRKFRVKHLFLVKTNISHYTYTISGCLLVLHVLLTNHTNASLLSCLRAQDEETSLCGIVGKELVNEFEALNERLEKKTSSRDFAQNMKFVREFRKDDKRNIFKKNRSRTLKAESLLLAQETLTEETSCDAEGHEIIYQTHRALQGRPFISENVKIHHRRIDKIFLYYYRQHERICREEYPRKVRTILKTMDQLKVNRVNFFADNAISQFTTDSFVKNRSTPLADRLFFVASAETDPQPRYIFKILKFLLANQPEESLLESDHRAGSNEGALDKKEKRFERIFQEYLAGPCEYYEQQLGPDIFVPLSFSRELHDVNIERVDFYRVWARFQFCKMFNKTARKKQEEVFIYANYRLGSINYG